MVGRRASGSRTKSGMTEDWLAPRAIPEPQRDRRDDAQPGADEHADARLAAHRADDGTDEDAEREEEAACLRPGTIGHAVSVPRSARLRQPRARRIKAVARIYPVSLVSA